jgi:prepilin-type processing-associated H-X9-DG protein
MSGRHSSGCNVGFADGHAKFVKSSKIHEEGHNNENGVLPNAWNPNS